MRILALDLATKTGWAALDTEAADVFSENRALKCGRIDFRLAKDDDPSLRAWSAYRSFDGLVDGVDAVYYEFIPFADKPMWARIYYGLEGVLHAVARQKGVTPKGVGTAKIKWEALGKGSGRAKKKTILSMARVQWPGLHIEDDNVADALWLLKLAARREGVEFDAHVGELNLGV